MWKIRLSVVVAAALCVCAMPEAQTAAEAEAVRRIRAEGLTRSEAPALFAQLVDEIGPRLTGSREYTRAAEWAKRTFDKWGLQNARLEPFEFGRGWQLDYFAIEMIEPRYMPLSGYPEAWTPSTAGDVIGSPIAVTGKTAEEIAAMKDTLRGAIVMQAAPITDATFIRRDRVQPADQPDVAPQPPAAAPATGRGQGPGNRLTPAQALRDAGPSVVLVPSRGEHGTLFVQAGRPSAPQASTRVVLIAEHYNMLSRMIARGIPVKLRVNVRARQLDDPNSYNVLAELPGSDPELRDQVVMIGAHLDSWHTAPGATDNADGVAAAMEALRILKAAGLQPKRTIRIALWGGEEQGLLGSRAWVERHLAGDANAAARDKLFVYFNIDPGKGPVYGWYLENKDSLKPVFDAWLEPFRTLGAKRNVRAGIGNTDHLSFIRAGVPGFNPVQDYAGYDVREHHTNVDTFERIKDDDLRQAAIVLASFLYHAGNWNGSFRN